ncbi:MAG: hypothetical protein U1E18_28010 [Brevundimonas sp.]|uniref:hypothetical protein n=1 Tax=Brevundimonas sp. TaxID=1871086 RepID=UPI002ABBC4F6|nr:hypothetical protein [Brevundimonas sp.]MDZ4113418.1 hypothetical protein [Brevundimonas sp.]
MVLSPPYTMQGATNDMAALNGMVLLVTIAILAAPVAILIWRSRVPTVTEPIADA